MRLALAMVAALVALPVAAEEVACFSGSPKKVTFDNGRTTTIIQRHGSDVTYTSPYAGGNDVVTKTHLLLFPKATRLAKRVIEYRWEDRLPKLDDLVPGFAYDVAGTMKSGDDPAQDYRIEGTVLAEEVVSLGKCDYPVLVIEAKSYLNDAQVVATTVRLSPEMMVILQTDGQDIATGKSYSYKAVALE